MGARRSEAPPGAHARVIGHLLVFDVQLVEGLDVLAHEADGQHDDVAAAQGLHELAEVGLQPLDGPHPALVAQEVAAGEVAEAGLDRVHGGVDLLLVGIAAGLDLLHRQAVGAEEHRGVGQLLQGLAQGLHPGLEVARIGGIGVDALQESHPEGPRLLLQLPEGATRGGVAGVGVEGDGQQLGDALLLERREHPLGPGGAGAEDELHGALDAGGPQAGPQGRGLGRALAQERRPAADLRVALHGALAPELGDAPGIGGLEPRGPRQLDEVPVAEERVEEGLHVLQGDGTAEVQEEDRGVAVHGISLPGRGRGGAGPTSTAPPRGSRRCG